MRNKTGVGVDLGLHSELQKALAAAPHDHVTIINTEYGKPFTVNGFSQFMRESINEAGPPTRVQAAWIGEDTGAPNGRGFPWPALGDGHLDLEEDTFREMEKASPIGRRCALFATCCRNFGWAGLLLAETHAIAPSCPHSDRGPVEINQVTTNTCSDLAHGIAA